MQATITKAATPAVLAITQLSICGNITPHVWYQRSEFRSASGRIDRNLIAFMGDILYWYRGDEIRDEERGGICVGHARKFAADMLQYDYRRRGAFLGMTKREMQTACTTAVKKGLIRIEYRTERYKNKLLHNLVYIEPIPEAIARTLSQGDVEPVSKERQANRGRHIQLLHPDQGIDGRDESAFEETSLNFERFKIAMTSVTSLIFEGVTSLNFEGRGPKFRDTYYESSWESSCVRKRGDLRAREGASAQGAQELSSSLLPAARDDVAPDRPNEWVTGKGVAPDLQHRTQQEQQAPDGAALPHWLFTEEDFAELIPLENVNDTSLQDVPGAAGGPVVATPGTVLAFQAIEAQDFQQRPQAQPGSPIYLHLQQLLGQKDLPTMLAETTRSGNLPRARWLQLTLSEVQAVETVALAEHMQTKIALRTLISRGLDRLIGSPWSGPKAKQSTPVLGGRCFEPAQKRMVEDPVPVLGKLLPGAQYRRKLDGSLVELVRTQRVKNRAGDGEVWVLNDNSLVGVLDLSMKFEFICGGQVTSVAVA